MRYLFFDTETTGLPKDYKVHWVDVDNWPRVVQLAWILTDDNGSVIEQDCSIILPKGYTIPDGMIHGITQHQAEAYGELSELVFAKFQSVSEGANFVVAHNIGFDLPVVCAEFVRNGTDGFAADFSLIPRLCTQQIGTDFCKLPNPYGYSNYKWPKLTELHQALFGEGFEGAHDALADIQATARCFFKLKELIPEVANAN